MVNLRNRTFHVGEKKIEGLLGEAYGAANVLVMGYIELGTPRTQLLDRNQDRHMVGRAARRHCATRNASFWVRGNHQCRLAQNHDSDKVNGGMNLQQDSLVPV